MQRSEEGNDDRLMHVAASRRLAPDLDDQLPWRRLSLT